MLSLALLLGLTACTAAPNIQAPDTQTDPQATVPDAGQTGQAEDREQSPADDSGTGKKTFSMGTTADYPPYEFIIINDKGEQEFVGIDISLAQALAEDMGAELKVVNMSFENLMIALGKGEVDCVIAAMEEDEAVSYTHLVILKDGDLFPSSNLSMSGMKIFGDYNVSLVVGYVLSLIHILPLKYLSFPTKLDSFLRQENGIKCKRASAFSL